MDELFEASQLNDRRNCTLGSDDRFRRQRERTTIRRHAERSNVDGSGAGANVTEVLKSLLAVSYRPSEISCVGSVGSVKLIRVPTPAGSVVLIALNDESKI